VDDILLFRKVFSKQYTVVSEIRRQRFHEAKYRIYGCSATVHVLYTKQDEKKNVFRIFYLMDVCIILTIRHAKITAVSP